MVVMFGGIDKAAELARRTANEERRPPTGVPPHDLHHHRNTGPMAKAKEGDVPVYREASGQYEPGAAGALQPHAMCQGLSASLVTATWTTMSLSAPGFQPTNGGGSYFSIEADGGVNVCRVAQAGTYRFGVRFEFDISSAGALRLVLIQHRQGDTWSNWAGNGSPPWPAPGTPSFVSVSTDKANFNAGEAFRVRAYHDAGANLSVNAWRFFIEYLGPPPA